MIRTLADQYLAQNAGRRYPFRDDTELPAWLPDSGVLDFRCTVQGAPAGTAVEARLVKAEHAAGGQAQFTVELTAGGVLLDELVFEVPENAAGGAPYTAYASGSLSHGALAVTSAAVPPSSVAGLPYDAEVEYLESTGTQWIDTGYAYNADSEFVCDAMLMSVPSDTYATMFGAVQNYNGVFLALNNTVPIQARFGANSVANIVSDLSVQNAVGVRHKYELSARRLAIDDDVFTRSGFTPYTVDRSIWLCSCNDSESGNINKRPCSLRVYSFDIYDGSTLVRDFRPVRFTNELGQSEGAVYDKVSGELFRNRGTGAFSRGDDLPTGAYALDIPFAATTVVCDSLKVHSIQSAHDPADARDEDDPAGLNATATVDGEIVLAEGRNAEPYLDDNRLRLDVFKGAGLGERCQSAVSGGQRCGTVLFTINGERPGSDGDIRIIGDGGITVTPDLENHAVEIRMDDEAARRMTDGCATACPTYATTGTTGTDGTDDVEEAE